MVDADGITAIVLPAVTAAKARHQAQTITAAIRTAELDGITDELSDAVEQAASWCSRAIVEPLVTEISTSTGLVIIACGHLSLIPIHAATFGNSEGSGEHCYLADVVDVSFAANVQSLLGAASPIRSQNAAVVVADHRLPSAQAESLIVANLLGGNVAKLTAGAEHRTGKWILATRANVLAATAEAPHAHFACHGKSDFDAPLQSAVQLSGEERLLVSDIMSAGAMPDLVVLSACTTATSGRALPTRSSRWRRHLFKRVAVVWSPRFGPSTTPPPCF